MSVFIDTSALMAILDADDANHNKARMIWKKFVTTGNVMVCSNYVLIETFALVQHRLGIDAVRTLQDDILPMLTIEWVDEPGHRAGVTGLLAASRRSLSLVDCVSFDVMRRLGIKSAFAFDRHFKEQGFGF